MRQTSQDLRGRTSWSRDSDFEGGLPEDGFGTSRGQSESSYGSAEKLDTKIKCYC